MFVPLLEFSLRRQKYEQVIVITPAVDGLLS